MSAPPYYDSCAVANPTASAYEITEEARLLLCEAGFAQRSQARGAVGEAAYYLSDTIAHACWRPPRRACSLLTPTARRPMRSRIGRRTCCASPPLKSNGSCADP